MRKNNEGYVLPLVMVVMVVLSLIAVGVMSVSLRNLKAQKADVARMQEQYAAQGELEKTVAALSAISHDEKYGNAEGAQPKAEEMIKSILDVDDLPVVWSEDEKSCAVNFSVEEGNTKITCTLLLENLVVKDTTDDKYVISAPSVVYTSYEIGGGGNG